MKDLIHRGRQPKIRCGLLNWIKRSLLFWVAITVPVFWSSCSSSSVAAATAANPTVMLPSRDSFLVQGLSEEVPAFAEFNGRMYAGRLPCDNGKRSGHLMFWLFVPEQPAARNTITVWLNGGPGCSSFFAGMFFEHGPVTIPQNRAGYCCVHRDEPFVTNPYSWTQATHMLYVEQPVGVGFSEGGPQPTNETEVASDFYAFLQNFYRVFDEYQRYKLFLTGESYAGMYIPPIAHKIYREQTKRKTTNSDNVAIQLEGMGIGNGLMDSKIQGPVRIDYAYWHGMIDLYTRDLLYEAWDACLDGRDLEPQSPYHSFNPPDDCGMLSAVLLAAGQQASPELPNGPNVYDVTTWDPYAVLKGDNTISKFYNNPNIKRKLHAPDLEWNGCMPGAGRRRMQQHRKQFDQTMTGRDLLADFLLNDKPASMIPYVGELLDGGIRIMFYNGDRDMSCNAAGTEQVLNKLQWHGADHWYTAPRGLWVSNETEQVQPAGYVKQHKNLQFIVVYNSGHLVPYNKPATALDLITRFLRDEAMSQYPIDTTILQVQGNKERHRRKKKHSLFEREEGKTDTDTSDLRRFPSDGLIPVLMAFVLGFGVSYFCCNVWRKKNHDNYQSIP